jgi:hypothetical protein
MPQPDIFYTYIERDNVHYRKYGTHFNYSEYHFQMTKCSHPPRLPCPLPGLMALPGYYTWVCMR